MLGIFDRALIAEPVEAWRYGPVVPTVYQRYRTYRGGSITTIPVDQSNDIDDQASTLINGVLKAYKEYSAWGLSAITHQPGTPWHTVYAGGGVQGSIIPNEIIRDYYKSRVEG